jgi:hypothetical protein
MNVGAKETIRADDEVVSKAKVLAPQKQVRELQRVLAKKKLENEILREAVKVGHEKMDRAVAVITRRGVAAKRVVQLWVCPDRS